MLVVNFDEQNSETFSRVFRRIGFEVDSVPLGQQAYEMMKKTDYDYVLMDNEPCPNGECDIFVFTKKSLQNAMAAAIRGFHLLENTASSKEFGADAVFTKPVKINQLISIIK